MKPRRWYSSPELNPNPERPLTPFASPIQLHYAARTCRQQGAIIKTAPAEPRRATRGRDRQAPASIVVVRRIDAA